MTDEEIVGYLDDNGYPPHIVAGGRAGLIARWKQFVEEVEPLIKPLFFKLQQKFLASPARKQLTGKRYFVLDRKWATDVELYRDENVPIETDITRIVNEYDKISGKMMGRTWARPGSMGVMDVLPLPKVGEKGRPRPLPASAAAPRVRAARA